MLKAGQLVAGRYLLESEIGEGAMGAVFRAQDQTLKRQVAIKFLFLKSARDPQAIVDQFLREARIAASVQHRNVIHTVDFGTMDETQPFMVMELLNGESLADRMGREPALSQEQLVHLVSLTLRGLAAVHDAGIVHRDLKPQNVFLQRDADAVYPKILDFGISRSVQQRGGDRRSAIATQEGLIVGTPDYMSPEQARGDADIDLRSDLYSMGVILYEGLSGCLPFDAPTVGELIVQLVTKEPPSLREIAPHVPAPLADLVAQAMAKNREQRFADARALRRALLAAAERSLPQTRRVAGSLPPVLPPASLKPKHAPAAAGDGPATWGDFEGLNASQLLDRSRPPATPAAAPAGPQQQRMVAHVASGNPGEPPPLLELEPASHGTAPALRGGASVESRPKGKARKAKPQQLSAEQALDPLYAGSDQLAPDIDYDRVNAATAFSSRKAQASANQDQQRKGQSRARVQVARPKVRYRRSWGHWVLPLMAAALVGYLVLKPALRAAPSGEAAGPSAAGLGSAAARVISDRALGELRAQAKARRASPGSAPPHMRDVVF